MSGHPGVILAPNMPTGDMVKTELQLTDWVIVTPRSIQAGAGHGLVVEPRLIVVSGADPYEPTTRTMLNDMFADAGQPPALYWLTGGAL